MATGVPGGKLFAIGAGEGVDILCIGSIPTESRDRDLSSIRLRIP